MAGFFIRLLVSSLALGVAAAAVPGLEIHGGGTLIAAALLLGLVNAVVRPLMVRLLFPVTFLTLGLFLLVINGAMLGLVSLLLEDFHITDFRAAITGAVIVSIVSWIALWLTPSRKKTSREQAEQSTSG